VCQAARRGQPYLHTYLRKYLQLQYAGYIRRPRTVHMLADGSWPHRSAPISLSYFSRDVPLEHREWGMREDEGGEGEIVPCPGCC